MRINIQSWLLACSLLLIGASGAWAQPAPCDPAAAPNTAGSCQFPNSTFPNGGPGCYVCQDVVSGTPECVPDDTFCDGISGGDESNICRIGECLDATGQDPSNPSGCEYDLNPGADENCVLCNSPEPVPFDHCGNGVCEPDLGEDCTSCGLDCNPAGYSGACLEAGDQALDDICLDPAGIQFVIFPGPPYPTSGQFPGDNCEDGNLCTDNVCGGPNDDPPSSGVCIVTDKVCEPDADFCCPAGCNPPDAGTCREVTGAPIPGCDPDCYVPVDCPIMTPTPTPTITPVPPFNAFLEGSGCSLSVLTGPVSAWFWIVAGLGTLAGLGLRRRQR